MNPGDHISRYRILRRIGKGGMGEVYQAEDTRLERQVALKFLPQDGFTEVGKSRFLNEARAAAKARHPNICPIHDIDEADGELFIVMAYIEGQTLARIISQHPLEPLQALDFSIQIAHGLACAHGLGIIHRDIKSSNIMVDRAGHASILDFGLALAPSALRLTDAGSAVGTPAYMSPEQIEGREVDVRTDLWSLGAVMYEMLTGGVPFQRDHVSAVIHAVLNDPLPAISSFRAGVPEELQAVVEKALAKERSERWQSADEMAAELKRLRGSGAVPVPAEIATRTVVMEFEPDGSRRTAPRLISRWISRWVSRGVSRWAVPITAALLIAAGAGVAWRHFRSTPAPAAESATMPAVKQVAILPFQVIGSDDQTHTVADGLVEVVAAALADLARTQGLSISTVAPGELRSRHVSSADEARRIYGVNLAIAGSAQPAGDKVEFTVSLIDALTLRQIAARTFLYDPKNPLVSSDQAVTQVVGMMKLDIPLARQSAALSRVTAADTAAPSAYSAYLEGRGLLARYDLPGNLDRAIASFTTATQQDSRYALAFSGLGEAYWRKAIQTGDKLSATLANQNAEYAVQLDPNLAIVHSVLGLVYRDAGRQQDAIREFQRAIDLAPDNAEASRNLAEIYKSLGRFDEAEALYIRSTKSRPTDWLGYRLLGIFYYERERYSEAEAALNQAKDLTPDNESIRRDLAGVYRMHGRYQESVAEYQQALRIRSDAAVYSGLGGAYYYQHQFQAAVSALEAATDLDSDDYRLWGNLGIYCKWAPGNESKSAPALRRAIELATKLAETHQSDYGIRANLAEYRARLGDAKGALAEIDRIPAAARGPFTTRLAIVYELTGHRDRAVSVVRANFKSPESLNQIKDDPDLAAVWREAAIR